MSNWTEVANTTTNPYVVTGIVNPDRYGFGLVKGNMLVVFDKVGTCVGEIPMTANMVTRKLPYHAISLLSSNDEIELAGFCNNQIVRYRASMDKQMATVQAIIKYGQFFKTLTRRGKVENSRYNQMIWVYMSTININSIIGGVLKDV